MAYTKLNGESFMAKGLDKKKNEKKKELLKERRKNNEIQIKIGS